MPLWAKQPSPAHPTPSQKNMFCQEIQGLPFYRLS